MMIEQFTHTASEDVERIGDWVLLDGKELPARTVCPGTIKDFGKAKGNDREVMISKRMTGGLCYHHTAGIRKDDLQRNDMQGENGQLGLVTESQKWCGR